MSNRTFMDLFETIKSYLCEILGLAVNKIA